MNPLPHHTTPALPITPALSAQPHYIIHIILTFSMRAPDPATHHPPAKTTVNTMQCMLLFSRDFDTIIYNP